jgi:hypothetical protein
LHAAFSGQTLDDVSKRGALFRDLGRWSHGQAIRAPLSGDDLSAIPRVPLPYGARLMPAPARWLGIPFPPRRAGELPKPRDATERGDPPKAKH